MALPVSNGGTPHYHPEFLAPTSSSMFTISAVEVEDNDEDAPAAANDHHVASVDDDDNDDDGVDICS